MEKKGQNGGHPQGTLIGKLLAKGIDLYTNQKYAEAIREWEKVLVIDPYNKNAKKYIAKAKYKLQNK